MAMSGQQMGQDGQFGGGLASLLGGLFTDPRRNFADAQRAYDPWMDKAQQQMNPFVQQGQQSMGKFSGWLDKMQDPSGFMNNLMGQYQESPWANFQQQQAERMSNNLGSASGLSGSTPLMQFGQQNARDISSQDMQGWLAKVLGINTEYGQGQKDLMGQGFNAATGLGNLFSRRGENEAQLAYNKSRAGDERTGNILGGLFGMGGGMEDKLMSLLPFLGM